MKKMAIIKTLVLEFLAMFYCLPISFRNKEIYKSQRFQWFNYLNKR